MSAPKEFDVHHGGHRTLADKLDNMFNTVLREVTDKEHDRDIVAAGGDKTIERRKRLWTDAEIAAEVGVTPMTIGHLRHGKRDNPGIKLLRRLARWGGVPVTYLAIDGDAEGFDEVEQHLAALHRDQHDQSMADRVNTLIDTVRPGGGELEYTNEEIAEAICCTPEQIRALREGEDVDISLKSMRRMAAMFGVTIGYIVDAESAERVDRRLAMLRELREKGVLEMALDAAKVKSEPARVALANMVAAWIQVEAQHLSDESTAGTGE